MRKTLVLTFNRKTNDVRQRVYRLTLEFVAENLPDTCVYKFVNNKELLKYVTEQGISSVVYDNEMHSDTAFLLKGLGVVQILVGMKKELLEISDIIIDPLVCKSERFLVGTKYLLPSVLKAVPAEEIAALMGMKLGIFLEEVNHNEAEIALIEVVQIYQKLDWDSKFFNLNIGYISCLRLTPNIEKHIKKFIRREKIDLLEYLCNCHDRNSVITSEENGYSFVDMRLTFYKFIGDAARMENRLNFSIGFGKQRDIETIQNIATDIYVYSRYYFDNNFDRNKVKEFYREWVRKAVLGNFDDFAYVLYDKNQPIGFCTIKKMRQNTVQIGLFGLNAVYRGDGLGCHFLNSVLNKLKEQERVNYVEVVTQGRNYAAQRLYQRCGFLTKSTELWYHKWFH